MGKWKGVFEERKWRSLRGNVLRSQFFQRLSGRKDHTKTRKIKDCSSFFEVKKFWNCALKSLLTILLKTNHKQLIWNIICVSVTSQNIFLIICISKTIFKLSKHFLNLLDFQDKASSLPARGGPGRGRYLHLQQVMMVMMMMMMVMMMMIRRRRRMMVNSTCFSQLQKTGYNNKAIMHQCLDDLIDCSQLNFTLHQN